jgi:hypothetical protein
MIDYSQTRKVLSWDPDTIKFSDGWNATQHIIPERSVRVRIDAQVLTSQTRKILSKDPDTI